MLLAKHLQLQKALIVIDDASASEADSLLMQHSATRKMHPESLVIITSRSSFRGWHYQPPPRSDVFEMELLPAESAAQLFALHAYTAGRQPVVSDEDHENLAQMIVRCCSGLPPTLKVSIPSW